MITGKVEAQDLKSIIRKISFIFAGIYAIALANYFWSNYGYASVFGMVLVWILILLAFASFMLVFNNSEIGFFIIIISIITVFFIGLSSIYPVYGTDSLAIESYAARLFSMGIDPYIRSNMAPVFSYYHLPYTMITPTQTGGYVNFLSYPGFSVILMMPELIGIQGRYIISFFNVLAFVILYYQYRRSDNTSIHPYVALGITINLNWFFYSIGGVSGIIWIDLIALSFIFKDKNYLSGALYGLSVSYRQTAIIVLPFYIYYLYKSGINVRKFLSGAVLSFIITNIPFIIMSPYQWFISVIGIGMQPILPIGFGISVLSFTYMPFLKSSFFYAVPGLVALFLIYMYIKDFDRLKYAFFAFPVIIFLFYYRDLLNYMMYWPFLMLLAIPEIKEFKNKNDTKAKSTTRKITAAFLVLIIVIAGLVIYNYDTYNPDVKIISVSDPQSISLNGITSMNVTVFYSGSEPTRMFFRIIPDNGMINGNGLLWYTNKYLIHGLNNVTIYPENRDSILPENTSFIMDAYYNNELSTYHSNGLYAMDPYGITNPEFKDFYMYKCMPAGWTLSTNSIGGTAHYIYNNGSLTIKAINTRNNYWAAGQVLTEMSSEYIMNHNIIMNLKIKTNGFTNVTDNGSRISSFYGLEITFDNDRYNIYIGYSNESKFYRLKNTIIILQKNMCVNLTKIIKIAYKDNFKINNAYLEMITGGTVKGVYISTYNNFNIVE
ncbi:Uncharacterized membrane protein [Picrophilus oshimae DSM 9789]|uniref:Uncharacterized membrane protein n=1 Tax=Picrophilus torridus (strain ATCC 700027 / DSM 9790 / JCM 10055 / NBRC 100828 / KAW 2/3) TaxID=1122961 RepID=A0A8G2FWX6_PICTO|nr:Uncharacterized membrane protein [Picrophilus oshimae DSM 9789]